MHAACHGNPVVPAKSPAKDEAVPCCKLLRATVVQPLQLAAQSYVTGSLQYWFVATTYVSEGLHSPQSFELDTGPPFSESFAECILKRSILAHAPPSL